LLAGGRNRPVEASYVGGCVCRGQVWAAIKAPETGARQRIHLDGAAVAGQSHLRGRRDSWSPQPAFSAVLDHDAGALFRPGRGQASSSVARPGLA